MIAKSIWRNVVYVEERVQRESLVSSSQLLAIKFRESVGSFVGVILEPFEWPPHNFVFGPLSSFCTTGDGSTGPQRFAKTRGCCE